MKVLLKSFSLIPLLTGAALLALGLWRQSLPYENERYYDPATGFVNLRQAAEVYTLAGALLTIVGLLIAAGCFVTRRSRRVAHSDESQSSSSTNAV